MYKQPSPYAAPIYSPPSILSVQSPYSPLPYSPQPTPLQMIPYQPAVFVPPGRLADFQTRQFNCMDDMYVCYDTVFCCYCQAARQQNAATDKPRSPCSLICGCAMFWDLAGLVLAVLYPETVAHFAFTGCCLQICYTRDLVRGRLGLPKNQCNDLLVSWFCTPCALSQQHHELLISEIDVGTTCGPSQLRPAAPPPVMMMQPVTMGIPVR